MIKVMKFGGSSVQDAEKIKHVCSIVIEESKKSKVALVCSAMKGITDLLLSSAKIAAKGDPGYKENIEILFSKQEKAVNELMSGTFAKDAMTHINEKIIGELKNIIKGVELIKECSPRTLDLIASFGERLNNFIIASYLKSIGQKASYIDSRNIVKTNKQYTRAVVNYDETYKKIKERVFKEEDIPVITGFIGSAEDGSTTTLGRNGSDFSASIIAAGLNANIVEIWTDVDGVLSADPRIVKDAFVVPEISEEEAMELSYFGAKVIHPSTVIPAFEKEIPICIKNTLNPAAPGTMIVKNPKPHNRPITGIASVSNVSIINIVGGGMIGTPGFASKVFETFAKNDINMIMISQASSEHTISIVCITDDAKRAITLMEKDLSFELESKAIKNFELKENLEIVSIIGDNMIGTPGIAGKLFSTLGDNGINVYAIAQGSSERNISCVIKKEETEKAIRVIHKSFLGV
ncbi:MAG: aspartate kinase [Spirochaetaceae bacterium]|nr:aspartate kinase [Spirochaetaceae bacterium]